MALTGAWLAFWPAAMITPRDMLLEFISGMTVAASIGLTVAFAPGAWVALRERPYRLNSGHLLVLGILLMAMSVSFILLWGYAYRVLQQPPYMVGNLFRLWWVYLFFLGALLPLLANDVDHHAMPTKGWLHIGLIVATGIGVVVVLILLGGLA